VLTVRINRPEVRNAISTQVGADLHDVFTAADQRHRRLPLRDPHRHRRQGVLRGGDLKERNGMTDAQWMKQHALFETHDAFAARLSDPADRRGKRCGVGGGCELISHATSPTPAPRRASAAGDHARHHAGAGGTQFLPRVAGSRRRQGSRAHRQAVLGRRGARMGRGQQTLRARHLMAETLATAQAIASNAPIATRQAKRSMHYGMQMDLRSALFFEIDVYNKMVSTEDRLEACAPSTRRRKPKFKGR